MSDPLDNLKSKIEKIRPQLDEARRHGNRSLLIDLITPLIKETQGLLTKITYGGEPEILRKVLRLLQGHLIVTAHEGLPEHDELGAFVGLPGVRDEELGKGAGDIQASSQELSLRGIREVINNSDHPQNDDHCFNSEIPHDIELDTPIPEKYHQPYENELDKPVEMCDNENHKAGPFTIEDFRLTEQPKQRIREALIEELEELLQQIEAGEI